MHIRSLTTFRIVFTTVLSILLIFLDNRTTLAQAKSVSPVLNCVLQNDDGTYTALFSTQNASNQSIEIHPGPQNNVDPAISGLPTIFDPGEQPAFAATFYAGNRVIWNLDGQTVVASDVADLRCASPSLLPLSLLELSSNAVLLPPSIADSTENLETKENSLNSGLSAANDFAPLMVNLAEQALPPPVAEPEGRSASSSEVEPTEITFDIINVDGIWSNGRSNLGTEPTCYEEYNTPDVFDENRAFYGLNSSTFTCLDVSQQTGFGIDGAEDVSIVPNSTFVLGQLTHYNNPISYFFGFGPLQFIDLSIQIEFGSLLSGELAEFEYTLELKETRNDGDCPYGAFPEDSLLCRDRLTVVQSVGADSFIYNGSEYTLEIVGWLPGTADSCDINEEPVDFFITNEFSVNPACLIGQLLVTTPAVEITKTLDQASPVPYNSDVGFTLQIQNTGNTPLTDIFVTDPLCDVISLPTSSHLDADLVTMLPDEIWTYSCQVNNVTTAFTNQAIVDAVAVNSLIPVTDEAKASVDVLPPPQPIIPLVDCVIPQPDGGLTAYFNYENLNTDTVIVPLGAFNYLVNTLTGVPVVNFLPGLNGAFPNSAFSATGVVMPLEWNVIGPDGILRTASADFNSPSCVDFVTVTKLWNGSPEPPADIGDFRISVISAFEEMSCQYEDTTLVCSDDGRLAVPPGGLYSVSESGAPAVWSPQSGIGTNFTVSSGAEGANQYCEFDGVNCMHQIENLKNAGDLTVEIAVDWADAPVDPAQTFTIIITGPDGFYEEHVVGADGNTIELNELAPGDYTIDELDPGENWSVTGETTITLESNQSIEVVITNRFIGLVCVPDVFRDLRVVGGIVPDPDNDGQYFALVENTSDVCFYEIGMASYEKIDEQLKHQEYYASTPVIDVNNSDSIMGALGPIVGPSSTIKISVGVPACASQIDVFFDAQHLDSYPTEYDVEQLPLVPLVLPAFHTTSYGTYGNMYGTRLLRAKHINGDAWCHLQPEENLVEETPPDDNPSVESLEAPATEEASAEPQQVEETTTEPPGDETNETTSSEVEFEIEVDETPQVGQSNMAVSEPDSEDESDEQSSSVEGGVVVETDETPLPLPEETPPVEPVVDELDEINPDAASEVENLETSEETVPSESSTDETSAVDSKTSSD